MHNIRKITTGHFARNFSHCRDQISDKRQLKKLFILVYLGEDMAIEGFYMCASLKHCCEIFFGGSGDS